MNDGDGSTGEGQVWSHVISLAQMLEDEPDLGPPEAVVERFAWRGRVTGIYSREKTGKSTILSFICAALTNGSKVLGWDPEGPAQVLWFGLEEHPNDTALRQKTFGTDPNRFWYLPWTADPLDELERAIREIGPALVVIDSLAAYVELAAPDSGNASSWKTLLGPLTRLARKYNIALVIILHAGKGKDADYRDSTAIGAEMDMLIEMRVGDVPGVRMFDPKGRWKVDPFSVIYEEAAGDFPPFFRITKGELSLDQKIRLFLRSNPGATKRQVRGIGGASPDIDQAIYRLLEAGHIEDRGDGSRSEFHIKQSESEKPHSHAMGTLGARSGHATVPDVSPDDHTPPKGGGSGTQLEIHKLPWDDGMDYERIEREAIQAEGELR